MEKTIVRIAGVSAGLLLLIGLFGAILLGYTRSQGRMILSVQSGSMQPAIRQGDAVIVRSKAGNLGVGTVISYRSQQNPNATITHRIVSVDNSRGTVVTKGDAGTVTDTAITADRIVGVVERSVPLLGYGLDVFRSPAGLAAAVYVPGMLVAFGEVHRLMRYYHARRYRLYAYPW